MPVITFNYIGRIYNSPDLIRVLEVSSFNSSQHDMTKLLSTGKDKSLKIGKTYDTIRITDAYLTQKIVSGQKTNHLSRNF